MPGRRRRCRSPIAARVRHRQHRDRDGDEAPALVDTQTRSPQCKRATCLAVARATRMERRPRACRQLVQARCGQAEAVGVDPGDTPAHAARSRGFPSLGMLSMNSKGIVGRCGMALDHPGEAARSCIVACEQVDQVALFTPIASAAKYMHVGLPDRERLVAGIVQPAAHRFNGQSIAAIAAHVAGSDRHQLHQSARADTRHHVRVRNSIPAG